MIYGFPYLLMALFSLLDAAVLQFCGEPRVYKRISKCINRYLIEDAV
jgi:hypothetical protein